MPAMSLMEQLEGDEIRYALGGYDALSAKMAYQAGADAVYMSGSSVAASVTGESDVGLTTMTEMANRAHAMAGAIDVPLITDADTGYGNPLNVRRTVREFERAGVTAIQIEDQTFPKRCGHFEGKDVIPAVEFEQKIRSAVDARESDDFLIVARTDAAAVHGIDDAIDRAQRYQDAGADVNFVEAPTSVEEMERINEEVPGPNIANMATGGKTPILPADELEDMGYDIALYAAESIRGAMKTFERIFDSILENGSQEEIAAEIATFEERNEILGLDKWMRYEEEFAAD